MKFSPGEQILTHSPIIQEGKKKREIGGAEGKASHKIKSCVDSSIGGGWDKTMQKDQREPGSFTSVQTLRNSCCISWPTECSARKGSGEGH